MTPEKGPSIRMADFNRIVPNGTWVRQLEGLTPRGVILPIEGILIRENVDATDARTVHGDTRLTVTPLSAVEPVRLIAGEVEYQISDEWIDFREMSIRVIEQRIKDGMGMSREQIGAALYSVASWIEAQGNKGYSDEEIMIGVPSFPIRILTGDYRPLWEHILFFGDGGRRDDFDGWGVHKRTPAHWWITWLDRFGLDHPQADTLMNAAWDEALAERAKRAVKRVHETYAGVDLEQAETRQIAHKAAALWLLSQWASQRAWAHWEAREMWRMHSEVYHMGHKVFRQELLYRQDQQPQPRRSKKKTQAARDDWATAASYFSIEIGFGASVGFDAHKFYTAAYVKACCESDAVPDLGIDYENLPRGLPTEPQGDETATGNQDEAEV